MRRSLRVLVAASLCLAPAAALVAVAPPAGAVTTPPVLTAPTSSSSNTDHLQVTYTLPQTPLAGSVALQFVGPTNCSLTLTNAGSASFVLDLKDPTSSANVVTSGCGTAIADGTYSVVLGYQNSAGDPNALAFATNVTVTTPVTLTPTLTSPTSSTTYNGTVPIAYTLPEAPLAGSVVLTFSGSTTCVLTMTDSQNVSFTLTPSAVAIANPIASNTCGSTIPNGTYTVALSYQDAGGAPQATDIATAVVLAPAIAPTTTTTTTTTVVTTTTTSSATTTTTSASAGGTGNGNGSVAGTDLAATGASGAAPLTLVGLGAAAAGLGMLVLRRRSAT